MTLQYVATDAGATQNRLLLPVRSSVKFLHLMALWALAVAQPTLALTANNRQLFITNQIVGLEIPGLLAIVLVVPPAILWMLGVLVSRASARAGTAVHLVVVAGLLALLALPPMKAVLPQNILLIPAAMMVGAVGTAVYASAGAARTWVTIASVAAPLSLAYFLLATPSGDLAHQPAPTAVAQHAADVPVVMVVFDELPVTSLLDAHGRIATSRFPNFARLARSANWYPRTLTAADHTMQAVPALVSGTSPKPHGPPARSAYSDNLFTMLAETHEVKAFEHWTALCGDAACRAGAESAIQRTKHWLGEAGSEYLQHVGPAAVKHWLPTPDRKQLDAHPDHPNAEMSLFLQRLRGFKAGRQRPPLFFLHSNLPHHPWRFAPTGRKYVVADAPVPGLKPNDEWGPNKWLATQAWQRHLLQVAYVDRLVGRLIRRLRQLGLWERSVVIITADHGASFRPGTPRRAISREAAADIANVPLFVKLPGQRGGHRDDTPRQTIDIVPTVAAVLGSRPSPRFAGSSLLENPGRMSKEARIMDEGGAWHRIPRSTIEATRREVLKRQTRLFGNGLEGLYRIGPNATLLGRSIDSLGRVRDAEGRESREDERIIDNRGGSHLLPVLIQGTAAPGRHRQPLAVSLNGRIVATTYSAADNGKYSAILPEASLRAGRNSVGVFEVRNARRPGLVPAGGRWQVVGT